MKKPKNTRNFLFAIAIISMLVLSMMWLSESNLVSVKAQNASENSLTGNLLAEEYVAPAGNNSRSFVGLGPGVTTPNLEWTTHIPGVTVQGAATMTAFGGFVFVQNATHTIALNATTGNIVYTISLPYTGTPYAFLNVAYNTEPQDIGNGYMLLGSDCYSVATGTLVWRGPPGFSAGQNLGNSGGDLVVDPQYLPAPMFFAGGCGWELTNPANPPTVLWNDTGQLHMPTDTGSVYDDGVMVYTSAGQTFSGFDAATGEYLWTVPTTSIQKYGCTATGGVFAFGGIDGNLDGWNITTGKLMYTFNPGTPYNEWSFSLASAYGMIYGHNEDSHLYAINATTGKLVWDAYIPNNGVGYSGTVSIAGGYIYSEMGENQYRNPFTGEFGYSDFCCFNAYNGSLVWSLPYEDGAPDCLQCNAYGNLYMIPTTSSSTPGVYTYSSLSLNGGTTLGEVICLGSGPAQNWPMYMNNPAHSSEGRGPTNLAILWNKGWGSGGYLASSPSFVDGIGYIGSSDHNIYAFNATNGDEIWAFTTKSIIQSTCAVANGCVYTGADDGTVYCLNAATGAEVWGRQLAAGPVACQLPVSAASAGPPSPMLVGNDLYIGANNYVYCLDATTGNVLWNFTWGSANIIGTPTIVNNVLYIAPSRSGPNGFLYELNAQTGALLLNVTLPYAVNPFSSSSPLAALISPNGQGIVASPTVDAQDNMVFVRQQNGYTYGINAVTGKIVWLYNMTYNSGTPEQWGTQNVNSVLYAAGNCYFNDYYSIVAVNALNGSILWNTYLSREDNSPSLSYFAGNLYACSDSGYFYVLNAGTGAKESFAYVSDELYSEPVLYNGNVYVAAGDWNVTCFTQAPVIQIAPSTPQLSPTPSYPTANEIAQEVLTKLPAYPNSPTAEEIAQKVIADLPTYPAGVSADEVAQKVLASLPANPTADQIAQAINNQLSAVNISAQAEPSTVQIVIIAAVALAVVIGIANLYLIRKRK